MPQLPIADKTTVDEINSKTGTSLDGSGAATIFGRLKLIYEYLLGNLSAIRAAKIDNLDATISSRATKQDNLSYLRPSDVIQVSSNIESSVGGNVNQFPIKKFLVNGAGKIRVKMEAKRNAEGDDYVSLSVEVNDKLYSVGSGWGVLSSSYQTFTVDNVEVNKGDTVKINVTSTRDYNIAYVRNARLCYVVETEPFVFME